MAGSVIAKESTEQASTKQKTSGSKIKDRVIKGAKITGYTAELAVGMALIPFARYITPLRNPEKKTIYKTGLALQTFAASATLALLSHGSRGLNKELNIIKHAKAVEKKLQISSRVKALKDKAMTKIRSLRKKESKQEA